MAENGTQSPREGQTCFLRHLNLVHPLELILDWVLDRDDFADRIVDGIERRIKGRSLAAAGWAGDEHDSVWQFEHALETLDFPFGHAQVLQASQGRVLPQQTHDYRLAVQHRDDRDTDVHLAVLDANLDPAILRQALFSDVEVTENLDPGHDGRLEAFDLGRHRDFLQHTVDAITNA